MLNRIGMQYASSIKYDHVNYVFVITGNEPKMQKQALIALNDLIEDQRPALVNYPQKPFRDLEDLSSSIASRPQADTASGLLIDVDYSPSDSSYLQATPSQETKQTIEFQIDDRVRDPYEMYFADKREKVELPIMLGERFNCNAIISGDGRTITVSGNSKDVSSCVSQIKQMQDYFLRPPFRLDKVALVYGSSREEFRLQFVPRGSVGPGRGTPPSSRQAYSRLQGPVSSSTEWHEQENPNFGFGPTKESSIVDKQTRPSSWKPIASNSKTVQQNSSQIPWQSSGTPGNLKSQSSSTSQSNITRREVQPEWPAQSFETKDEDDFPSLGSVSKSASKSVSRPSVSPTPPKSHKPKTYKDEAGAILDNSRATTPQHMTSRSNSIVFGEQDLAYLENIPAQRSAVSRPREHDNIGLEQAALRDPTKDQEDAQRTIRSLPRLQASPETPIQRQVTPQAAFITGMRNYNMRRLSESIRNGLKELRGQRKEIRLVGRLGCVLYPMDNFILNQFWEYTQLESVIVKKREIRPVFSPIVTTNNANFNSLYGFLRTPKTETAHFEIECDTRINPTSRFTKTLVTVPTTIAVLDRVVTPWETFGEVIWNSVDKNMDFEILLQAREGAIRDTKSALGRTDVKPFSAFRKRLSIGMRNSHITCHEIKPLLEVRNINFRETLTYEKPGKFTFVVHKVEELQLTRTQGVDAVTGRTSGPGKKWYEFE
ncbi:hypothetical protein BGZ80_005217, partial [Entomortierella chlamydospora]